MYQTGDKEEGKLRQGSKEKWKEEGGRRPTGEMVKHRLDRDRRRRRQANLEKEADAERNNSESHRRDNQ